ncbi:MAG: hypothetical protein JST21_07890 [Bacteroidetes bacterium]|nr:hypothetical protein [Bacteroidota bacterium]
MKTLSLRKNIFSASTIAVILLLPCHTLFSQVKSSDETNDFLIAIEKTNNGIKMQGIKGCSWHELAFTVNDEIPQAVNQFGMTSSNKTESAKDTELADFLFTITKNNEGIALKGIKGTAWSELSFALRNNTKQSINRFGMTKQD